MSRFRLPLHMNREVTECGANLYAHPTLHPDRTMDVHDLLFLQEGEWAIRCGETNHLARPGDVLLLRAGLHHFSPVKCPAGTRTHFIHFTTAKGDMEAFSDAKDDSCALLRTLTPCARYPHVRDLFLETQELFWSDRPDRRRQMALLLDLLLGELAYIGDQSQTEVEWMSRLSQVFREEPTRTLALEEAAELAGMSVRSLSSRFKALTGQSVYQYQLNLKLEMAYACIRSDRDRTLSDVADSFGFYDAYQFSRLFKKKYGAPPSHFRQSTQRRFDGSIHE